MLGIDLSETTSFSYPPEVEWTIGLLPLAKYDEIMAAVEKANAPGRRHLFAAHRAGDGVDLDAVTTCETCESLLSQATVDLTAVHRQAVRWGVRATNAQGLRLSTETVKLAGHDYTVLTDEIVERLSRVSRGTLMRRLANAVIDANSLDARDVLGFK